MDMQKAPKKQPVARADDQEIREIIERWAKAVRDKDFGGILARHATSILMFDVPPPFESRGIEAYRETWDLFYSTQPGPIAFDIQRMDIVAGADVAFAAARMQCEEKGKNGELTKLDFRLTVGLRKIGGRWMILHEHHSVPAT
jgi:ketosteroid isomerase-like protein